MTVQGKLESEEKKSTSADDLPPQYESDLEPPVYALQSHFNIGDHVTPCPLVSANQLKTHLKLLKAFKDLRTQVEDNAFIVGLPKSALGLEPHKRWVWFLELAVERCVFFDVSLDSPALLSGVGADFCFEHRFQRWAENMKCESMEEFATLCIPPLDVLLVFHSYMLNPM
jgi:hypothetical protein